MPTISKSDGHTLTGDAADNNPDALHYTVRKHRSRSAAWNVYLESGAPQPIIIGTLLRVPGGWTPIERPGYRYLRRADAILWLYRTWSEVMGIN